MLLASRGEPVPSSMLRAAAASSKPQLAASALPVEASNAPAAITGDLHDAVVAKQEPLLKALANVHDDAPGELWLVRMPVAPSDLPQLVQELATLLDALPIAVTSHGLIGLMFVAMPSAPPVILALSRGSPKTMLAVNPNTRIPNPSQCRRLQLPKIKRWPNLKETRVMRPWRTQAPTATMRP
jgi:hypothetical protein